MTLTGKHQLDFSDVSLILHQPLEAIFAGQYFKFAFPSPKRKTVSKTLLSLSELLRGTSSKGQCLIASAVDPVFPVSCSVLSLVRQSLATPICPTPKEHIENTCDTPVSYLPQSPSSLCSSTILSEEAPAVRLVPPQDGSLSPQDYDSFSKDGVCQKNFLLFESTTVPSASKETDDVSSNDDECVGLLSQSGLFCTSTPAMTSSSTEIPGSHDASFWREFYHNSQPGVESCQNISSDSITPVDATALNTEHEFWDMNSQLEIEIISEIESDWLSTQIVKQKLFSSPGLNIGSSYLTSSDRDTGSAVDSNQTTKRHHVRTLVSKRPASSPPAYDSSLSSTLPITGNSSSLDLFNELTPVHTGISGNCLPKSKKPRQAKASSTPVPCSGRQETDMPSSPVVGMKSPHHCTSEQLKGLALVGKLTPLLSTQLSTTQQQTGSGSLCFTPDLI